jgi:hypothetical protein
MVRSCLGDVRLPLGAATPTILMAVVWDRSGGAIDRPTRVK